MYAIIETGGKQYKVSEGDIITVEKLAVEAGSEYKFDKVLVLAKVSASVAYSPLMLLSVISAW